MSSLIYRINNHSVRFHDSLRARFEQMQQEEPKLPNARVKVNRFVVRLIVLIFQFNEEIVGKARI